MNSNGLDRLQRLFLDSDLGFAFVARDYPVAAAGVSLRIDLLYYHLRLRSLIAVNLSEGEATPERASRLNLSLSILDDRVKHPADAASIGLLLGFPGSRPSIGYAMRDPTRPPGISAYRLCFALPRELRGSVPTVEQLSRAERSA